MNTLKVALIALGLICLVAGETIVSLQLNKAEGQMYALSTHNWLYELDNVAVEQNNKHQLNISISATIASTYIKKINGKKSVFQTFSDPTPGTIIAKFDLPFGNKPVLNAAATTNIEAYGYSGVPTVFVDKELIAITISNGNKLNLFNLANMTQTDDIFIYQGIRQGATAVLYNHKTRTAVVFKYTFLPGGRTYRLHAKEYRVVNYQFVEVNTTFPEDNVDFQKSKAIYAAFDASNNKYWVLDDQSKRLIKFSSSNLSAYSFIALGDVNFLNGIPAVAYNFGSQLAYVVSGSEEGFYVQEVDLASGTIRRAASFNTGANAAATVELDVEEGNLYVGLIPETSEPAKISVIDLGNFSQNIITLIR